MKRCMYCGFENDDTAVNCGRCGYHLLETPPGQMPPLRSEETDSSTQTGSAGSAPEMNGSAPFANGYKQNAAGNVQGDPQYAGTQAASAVSDLSGASYAQQSEAVPAGTEAGRGESYAAQHQYTEQGQQYGGQNYGYAAQAAAQQNYGGQQYGYDHGAQYSQNGAGSTAEDDETYFPILEKKSRKWVRSPLFFLASVLYVIMVASRIAYLITGGAMTNVYTFLHTLNVRFGENVPSSFLSQGMDMLQNFLARFPKTAVYAMEVGICLPSVLIMISLWMMYSGVSPKRTEISTSGFTFARVVKILQLIVVCALLICGIGICVSFVVAYVKAQSVERMIFCIIILLIVMLFTVLTILYYIQLLFSIRVVRSNVKDGEDLGRIPGFVLFVGFLGFLAAGISMLPMAPDDYIGLVTRGASAVWLLLITIWGICYRTSVKVQ